MTNAERTLLLKLTEAVADLSKKSKAKKLRALAATIGLEPVYTYTFSSSNTEPEKRATVSSDTHEVVP